MEKMDFFKTILVYNIAVALLTAIPTSYLYFTGDSGWHNLLPIPFLLMVIGSCILNGIRLECKDEEERRRG